MYDEQLLIFMYRTCAEMDFFGFSHFCFGFATAFDFGEIDFFKRFTFKTGPIFGYFAINTTEKLVKTEFNLFSTVLYTFRQLWNEVTSIGRMSFVKTQMSHNTIAVFTHLTHIGAIGWASTTSIGTERPSLQCWTLYYNIIIYCVVHCSPEMNFSTVA